jgi:hypothetical protein
MPTSTTVTIDALNRSRSVNFECEPLPGSFSLTLSGLGTGMTLDFSLTGPSARTGMLGESGLIYTGLLGGNYTWSLDALSGYDCNPLTGGFTLVPGGSETASISCTALGGSLAVSVAGATAEVSYSGPESGGGTAGSTPTLFAVAAGSYTVGITDPPGFSCSPQSTMATVVSGQTASVMFECTPTTGTIRATVTGATATVSYTGPASGSAAVGATPVDFSGLPVGNYSVSIADPSGFTCSPSTIPIALAGGATEPANFTCSPVALPMEIGVDISAPPQTFGVVDPGVFMLSLLDGMTVVGMVEAERIGTLFWAPGPFRFGGTGATTGLRLKLGFDVNAQLYPVANFTVCTLNSALDGANPAKVTYRDAGMAVLGTDDLSSSPGCFTNPVPGGTMYADITGPIGISYDFNGIRFTR